MKSKKTKYSAFLVVLFCACSCSSDRADVIPGLEVGDIDAVASTPINVQIATKINATKSLEFTTENPSEIFKATEEATKPPARILFIFGSGFDYRHYAGTRYSLERNGYRIQVASSSLNPIEGTYMIHDFENFSPTGNEGQVITADLLLQDVQPADYRAIIFIVDSGLTLNPSPHIENIILDAVKNRVVLATQEYSIYLLAESNLLQGKKITANPLICQDMEVTYSAICTLMPVQRDAGVVTSDPTVATFSFARAILAEIEEMDGYIR